jgi:multimeric flavodoxin WrbA
MKRLLIIWHSRTGTAEGLARAAAAGATAADEMVTVELMHCDMADKQMMLAADGYVFAGPENLASLSGAMKEMADRLYYPLLGQIEGRPWALIIAAGTDGAGAVRQWQRIATGWRLKAIAEPMLVRTGADTAEAILAAKMVAPEALAKAHELGAAFAAGLAMGIY